MRAPRRLLPFVVLLATAAPALPIAIGKHEAELVTDRPDQTESAEVVPLGSLQLEIGSHYHREQTPSGALEVREAPATLLRYGVTPRLELRLAWPGRIAVDAPSDSGSLSQRGHGDPEAGFKLALGEARGGQARSALLVHATLPAGKSGFGSPRADLSARLAVAHDLSAWAGWSWNLGLESGSSEDGRRGVSTLTRWVYSGALGFDLGPRWGLFVELFGDLPASDPAPSAHAFDGGVTYRLRPGVQLDAAVGRGYSGAAPDFFAGVGIAIRLDR